MKKTLYFVRHGQYTRKRGSDLGLTGYGVGQIIDTAEEIEKDLGRARKIRIYHSPQKRAKESAIMIKYTLNSKRHYFRTSLEESIELDCDEKCVGKLVNKIHKDKSVPRAILISHQPDLEEYLGIELGEGEYRKRNIK